LAGVVHVASGGLMEGLGVAVDRRASGRRRGENTAPGGGAAAEGAGREGGAAEGTAKCAGGAGTAERAASSAAVESVSGRHGHALQAAGSAN